MQYLDGSMGTVITLEINADSFQFTTNLGNAKIRNVSLQNFEAHSTNGVMAIEIENIGLLDAEFSLNCNCSANVLPIQSKKLYIVSKTSFSYSQSV